MQETREKIKELERELAEEDLSYVLSGCILSKGLRIKGKILISGSKIKAICYKVPVEYDSKILGKIVGLIANYEEVDYMSYESNHKNELRHVSAWRKGKLLLEVVSLDNIYIYSYSEEASRIAKKIIKELNLVT